MPSELSEQDRAAMDAFASAFGTGYNTRLLQTALERAREACCQPIRKLQSDLDRMLKELNGGQYYSFYTHVILPQLQRTEERTCSLTIAELLKG